MLLRKQRRTLKRITMVMLALLLVISNFSLPLMAETASETTQISNLKVESIVNPLGLETQSPRFSWMMESDRKGQKQTAYQILVASSNSKLDEGVGDIWDSGKVASDQSINIEYEGEALSPTTRYYWTVKVWDSNDNLLTSDEKTWFETGLMDTGWDNAEWIGGTEYVLNASTKPVFNLEYEITIPEGSTKGSFIFGANDPRLLDRNKNNYSIEGENYIKYEIDLAELEEGTGPAKLDVYRKGYGPEKDIGQLDETQPIATGTIDSINDSNKNEPHAVKISVSSNAATASINGQDIAITRAAYPDEEANNQLTLNPLNAVQDVPTFPRLNEIGFSVDPNQQAKFSNIKISNVREPNGVLFSETIDSDYAGIFEDYVDGSQLVIEDEGFTVNGNSDGVTIYSDPSHTSDPMLRTEVDLSKEIQSARLYATARGIYEFYINGEKVGEDFFAPGATEYAKRITYQTYNVTDMMNEGENAISTMLSSGWWHDQMTFNLSNYNFFGDHSSLLAKLVITYKDGTTETVGTDTENWKYYDEGPITYSSFFSGEDYDATREEYVDGWDKPGFDDSEWSKPEVITPLDEFVNPEIVSGVGESVTEFEEITAKSYTEPRPGVYVYDMGTNMVGVPQITVTGEKGQVVTMRTAEMVYPDLPAYQDINGSSMVGMILTENYRAALSTDTYTLKGDKEGETYQPRFTFHGYRYLEITGIDEPLPLEQVKGIVLSSINELTGSYETSHPLVNQLFENITRSQLGNFLSIPTDTPARDERMGWLGDAQVFARTATYNADVQQFFARFTDTMRDSQGADGGYPNYAPRYVVDPQSGGWLAWAAAGVIVPYETYQQYGDTKLIEEHYESMTRFINGIHNGDKISGYQYLTNRSGIGDHISVVPTDTSLMYNAIYGYLVRLMSEMADAVGKTEDSDHYIEIHEGIKEEWNQTFVDPETYQTRTTTGEEQHTQTSYSLPLYYGMFNDEYRQHAADYLANLTEELGYTITTGFLGTAPMNPALSANGHKDTAYKLLESTDYPSWLYPVVNGATSIWERWNSYTHEDGFGGNNSMNSFNHYALGAVGEWMYNYSLGIQRDANNPGFKHFNLKPEFGGTMTYAKGSYNSIHGKIESSWELSESGDIFTYEATVPANTTATLYLPTVSEKMVIEGDILASNAEGLDFVKYEDGKAVFELQSGSYEFHSVINGSEISTIEALHELLEDYISSGDITAPLTNQLENSLKQVQHHTNKGASEMAEKHINNFIKHLGNKEENSTETSRVHLLIGARSLSSMW
ncbi:Bacterial alpha-L-rhamnosidase [Gracilibacillus salitolerans]|uniref:alpha-L-rhamnosidase n=1 Tax=Gracilibacillus salitolerans TaxID=2663022 RepID=A0A5Q2THX8_9BACI|nr:family 78 glycoside hydrolase catalytic domain [Gracilibacillus salitolerans]QGH33563.1 Bacterial alpha-L-rhamnosidase [Gracilibacillus salitolerans]